MSINVRRKKLRLGLIYGIVAGLSFAIFAWGVDAWLLARANAVFFWVKFIPGLIICVVAGGIVGWLTIRFENHGIALLLWGLLAVLYSWLVVLIPLSGAPYQINLLDPGLARWFDFSPIEHLVQFRVVGFIIIGLVAIICGLLEINLVNQALLSSYKSAAIMAMLVCIFLFGLVGSATDQMINTNLREPVQVINSLIQFAADNEGVEVPRETARQMHLSAVRQITEVIQKPRQLTLIGYDGNFGIVDTLVDFDGTLVKCTTVFAQPTDCIILTSNP